MCFWLRLTEVESSVSLLCVSVAPASVLLCCCAGVAMVVPSQPGCSGCLMNRLS